jgi:hypothetical protein
MEKQICPYCKKLDLKSTLTYHGSSTTLMGCPTWYDEEGNMHHHDMNKTSSIYSCSMGHEYQINSMSKCPSCDFGNQEPEYRLL